MDSRIASAPTVAGTIEEVCSASCKRHQTRGLSAAGVSKAMDGLRQAFRDELAASPL
tara:strand:- start:339 stop:509 length:171 start_codon:yes stop_codon:yes gene_type:complete